MEEQLRVALSRYDIEHIFTLYNESRALGKRGIKIRERIEENVPLLAKAMGLKASNFKELMKAHDTMLLNNYTEDQVVELLENSQGYWWVDIYGSSRIVTNGELAYLVCSKASPDLHLNISLNRSQVFKFLELASNEPDLIERLIISTTSGAMSDVCSSILAWDKDLKSVIISTASKTSNLELKMFIYFSLRQSERDSAADSAMKVPINHFRRY